MYFRGQNLTILIVLKVVVLAVGGAVYNGVTKLTQNAIRQALRHTSNIIRGRLIVARRGWRHTLSFYHLT